MAMDRGSSFSETQEERWERGLRTPCLPLGTAFQLQKNRYDNCLLEYSNEIRYIQSLHRRGINKFGTFFIIS